MNRVPSLREVRAHHPAVAILPTAPERRVAQNHNRAAHAARKELPQFTGEWLFPSQREAMKLAQQLVAIEPSPVLELLTAIVGALEDGVRLKIAAALAVGVVKKNPHAEQALAILRASRPTVGECIDLDFAFRRLREGRP